ncbi:glycoside hydrolase [Mycolicibacterium neoaurum]|uniref:coiled-coil domain-containing protein n=1 Tax=Mycolicibacterium neoaurum TaxID=1795 RepID=UPI00248B9566|nr:glycoside hydrolase [Mycolicibacterium neoaurum]WBP97299.1 glycoside hydrolase [Mycolicibacterium neoaurum]WBS11022.1 glycoside hydrolase [Mycolicibacterium neoaurum]
MTRVRRKLWRTVSMSVAAALVTGFSALSVSSVGVVNADPAADALAKLEELSSQALKTREAVTAAQRDADTKLAEQVAADARQRADAEILAAAHARLAPVQAAADRVAVMTYTSGRTGQLQSLMTASSPQQLIDNMSLQQAVATHSADRMANLRAVREQAAVAARTSETSAAAARLAAEQSAAVRADLQTALSELLRQLAAAEAQYAALTPQQQAIVDSAPPPAAPAPDDPAIVAMPGQPSLAAARVDIPEAAALPVGVANEAGLQPNAILAARSVSQQFPQISEIGGVRPDSKPWHPSGLAIDIMIPNAGSPEGIALGDQIMAYALANAGRFGLQDVIWRGTYYTPAGPQASGYGHFDHVHLTVTRR